MKFGEFRNDARIALLERLPAREGEVLSQELAEATVRAVKDFDEHLRVGFAGAPNGESAIQIALEGYRSDRLRRAIGSDSDPNRQLAASEETEVGSAARVSAPRAAGAG